MISFPVNQHAIVIGGSITGLLTARVLSHHFEQVTLIERDPLLDRPEPRRGQPQTRHLHGLLTSGKQILERYFPDLIESLVAGGAVSVDMSQVTRWYILGDYRLQYPSGMMGILASRPFLEWQIRQRVTALANVTVLDRSRVESLIASADRSQIIGVKIRQHSIEQRSIEQRSIEQPQNDLEPNSIEPSPPARAAQKTLMADLVIDASGRNSPAPGWLAGLGYAKPPETVVTVGLGYATRIYRRRPHDLVGALSLITSPDLPHHQRGGIAFPIEGDRWIVTLAGWVNDQPPLDEAGFLAFAQSLPVPDIYHLIAQAEPLSEVIGYQFPASLRRHYERLNAFPAGYLVMGDAICSFDPIYGQGMSSAALQAALLDDLLHQSIAPTQLPRLFFRQAAKIIDTPWQLTISEDFRIPTTQGKKPLGTDLINAYGSLVQQATHHDPIVYGAFLQVMNLLAPPSRLFHPKIIWRVLKAKSEARFRSQT
jgi:2-polyprenyl-6-methoxyphenol hydroxylase-like FAD-dependent oxidoreductase